MKIKNFLLVLILFLVPLGSFAKNYHYSSGDYKSKTYYSNGIPKHRSMTARNKFLKSQGIYNGKVPKGYQVDHIVPLSKGGSDTPSNMQLLTIQAHKQKTNMERKIYGW